MKFEKLIMLLKNLFNLAYMYVGHNNIALKKKVCHNKNRKQ